MACTRQPGATQYCTEAADAHRRIAELEAALAPFAALAKEVAREAITSPTDATVGLLSVRYADLRSAAAALQNGDALAPPVAPLSRRDVVRLIQRQFRFQSEAHKKKTGRQYHYGVLELRELLDAIYGGPPVGQDEWLDTYNPALDP